MAWGMIQVEDVAGAVIVCADSWHSSVPFWVESQSFCGYLQSMLRHPIIGLDRKPRRRDSKQAIIHDTLLQLSDILSHQPAKSVRTVRYRLINAALSEKVGGGK